MIKPLTLDRLTLVDVRNLERVDIEPGPRINVIAGNNGQGKTSVLEGIYALATSKSFRSAKPGELVRHTTLTARLRGRFTEDWPSGKLERSQGVDVSVRGKRDLFLDAEAPASLIHYATRSPVVVFEPKQLSLTTGAPVERRTLLDRVTLFTHPHVAAHRARYAAALKERFVLLQDRHHDRTGELQAYEAILAEHGANLTAIRAEAVRTLLVPLEEAFRRIAAPTLKLEVCYVPGGSADPEEVRSRLALTRRQDQQRKRTSYGPHRDDLALLLDGHDVRLVASQGQHRALTLALKSAELTTIAQARGVQPILLLDDVSSELDPQRTSALFDYLGTTESQIFLTTTRPELIFASLKNSERANFIIENGSIRRTA